MHTKEAEKQAAFLRIITPKNQFKGQTKSKTYVYKRGSEGVEEGEGALIERARVSNFDGKNMDPCLVKRHHQGLKRCGFVNNLHAKGMF